MCKFKKAIAVMLSAVIMLTAGSMPITVNAATVESDSVGTFVYGDFRCEFYSESNSYYAPGIYIDEYIGTDTEVVVPSEINGMMVKGIGAEGPFNENITNIILPDTLKEIKRHAFTRCTSLKTIVIPDGVKCIEYRTFYECSSLESVTLGSGTKYIDEDAFAYCTNLKSILIPDGLKEISYGAFLGCENLSVVYGYKGTLAESFANAHGFEFVRCYKTGDLDLDLNITVLDVTLMQRYCAGDLEIIDAPFTALDVDENDSVDINDATAIQRLLVE